jgi:hypothetical protein
MAKCKLHPSRGGGAKFFARAGMVKPISLRAVFTKSSNLLTLWDFSKTGGSKVVG